MRLWSLQLCEGANDKAHHYYCEIIQHIKMPAFQPLMLIVYPFDLSF